MLEPWFQVTLAWRGGTDLRWPKDTPNVHISTPPFTVSKKEFYMFNRYSIFSAAIAIVSVTSILKPITKYFIMPLKPRLNVQNFPRPPLLERTNRHLQVKWHGQIIADTKDAYWVLETYHAPSIHHLRHFQSKLISPSILPPHIRGLATPDAYQEIDVLWMERLGNLLHRHIEKRGRKRRDHKR